MKSGGKTGAPNVENDGSPDPPWHQDVENPPGPTIGWGVITSYSIHYTKLYDPTLSPVPEGHPVDQQVEGDVVLDRIPRHEVADVHEDVVAGEIGVLVVP